MVFGGVVRWQNGFSLMELMVAVAIAGLLIAVALPAYQEYMVKSQITAGLSEVSGGKNLFESKVLTESVVTFDLEDIGLPVSTPRCDMSMDSSDSGFIRCTLKGNPSVNGKTVEVVRIASGSWVCRVDNSIPEKYFPVGCG